MKKTDVIIIGGGLGGLSAAILLARLGKKVVLFEKEKYPFHRVCGEYISMESWDFLQRLGVPLADLGLPIIKRLKVSAPNGKFVETELDMGGFGISRFTLDAMLVEIARKEGVLVKEGVKVAEVGFRDNVHQVLAMGEEWQSDWCIGAYGKRSNLDVSFGRKFVKEKPDPKHHYVGVKYHVRLDFPDDRIELHNFEDGYCGISKVDDGKFCICYLTKASNLQKSGGIKEMETQILRKNPFLDRYFSEAEFLFEKPIAISQVSFSPKTTIENHIFMLGDAAGLIAPLCGNGMSIAMNAAQLLATTLQHLSVSQRAKIEYMYTQQYREGFSVRLKVGRTIQYFFGSPSLTNAIVTLFKTFPTLIAPLVKSTHGERY